MPGSSRALARHTSAGTGGRRSRCGIDPSREEIHASATPGGLVDDRRRLTACVIGRPHDGDRIMAETLSMPHPSSQIAAHALWHRTLVSPVATVQGPTRSPSSMFQQGDATAYHRPGSPALGHPLARIAAIAVILALAHYRWLQFPWRMPVVGVLGIALVWLETRSLGACGLQRRPFRAWLGWTLLLLALVIGLVNPFVQPLIDALTGTKADYSGYGALRGNFNAAAQLAGDCLAQRRAGRRTGLPCVLDAPPRSRAGPLSWGPGDGGSGRGALFGAMHLSQGISGCC